jgi:hypothetical protein
VASAPAFSQAIDEADLADALRQDDSAFDTRSF